MNFNNKHSRPQGKNETRNDYMIRLREYFKQVYHSPTKEPTETSSGAQSSMSETLGVVGVPGSVTASSPKHFKQ